MKEVPPCVALVVLGDRLAQFVSALSSHFIWPPIPTKPNFLSTHPDRATVVDTSFVESRHHHLFVEQVLLRSDRATVADTSSDRTASSSRDTSYLFVEQVLLRSTRESKPCCFRASDTTRRRSVPTTYQERRNDLRIVPTTRQIEEFFACAEQQQERLFIEKYNFDVVNDLPFSGRYEWMEVGP
ncbi:hypothetical protein Q3G72_006203 [Acer saccharum]|nr:hypothetical protein Q3G72_006203 [Acer saccharum]